MTKKEFSSNITELVQTTCEDMLARISKLVEANSLPLDDYPNDYLLPKMVMSALCTKMSQQWEPLTADYRAVARQLTNII